MPPFGNLYRFCSLSLSQQKYIKYDLCAKMKSCSIAQKFEVRERPQSSVSSRASLFKIPLEPSRTPTSPENYRGIVISRYFARQIFWLWDKSGIGTWGEVFGGVLDAHDARKTVFSCHDGTMRDKATDLRHETTEDREVRWPAWKSGCIIMNESQTWKQRQ